MCVIISQPPQANLLKDRAQRLWNHNDDGGGYAFIDSDGRIQTYKSLDFKDWWKSFETARSGNPRAHFLIHFRIATHGEVNLDNVHPFRVNEHTVMAHNGIIKGVPEYKDGRSDTRVFIDEVLPALPADWLDNPYIVQMVEEWIGWSKLMFLTTDPNLKENVYILNEEAGCERDGMWFSNSTKVDDYSSWVPATRHKASTTVHALQDEYMGERGFYWDGHVKGYVQYPQGQTKTVKHHVSDEDLADWLALDDREENENSLEEKRKGKWLYHTIFYAGADSGWECFGCEEEVDPVTGECSCWDRLCVRCEHFAAECICKDGYSSQLINWDEATDEQQMKAISMTPLWEDEVVTF